MNRAPAQTRHSLLASATVAPRSIAASVGLQPDRAGDRRHHPVGRALRGFEQRGLAGRRLDAAAGQARPSARHRPPDRRPRQSARRPRARVLRERRGVAPRGDRLDAIALRFALDQIDRAGADRAGGAENGDAAHGRGRLRFRAGKRRVRSCAHHTSRPRAAPSKPPRSKSDQAADERRRPETVEPVHHAAMAGNEMACILGAELALDPGFEQIADLRHHRQQQRDDRDRRPVERCRNSRRPARATIMAPSAPAIAPDQVFFGLTAGISFGPPKARPAK